MKSKYKNTFLNWMLSAVDNGVNVKRFRKQFSMKDAVYVVANAWDPVTKKTITGAWHNLWTAANRRDLGEQRDNTEDLTDEKMTADLLRYANSLPSESISKLEEVDVEEVFNIDNEAPTAFSLTDGEIAEMVLNDCEHNRSDDEEDVVSTAKRVSTQKTVKMCDKLDMARFYKGAFKPFLKLHR
ncbi:hypothetical protein M514_00747 [Trichuris suis]|uniref:DDE-1 domain-containing protein n=1 Tax=Trichuris suis TaxID=68888 RepID=A0A085N9G3_9BILA|nr:hypothetical protein M513_00747 [Trichuris suis]KFD66109.1 hypothetical protein M514_00747 [Trichuris suis]